MERLHPRARLLWLGRALFVATLPVGALLLVNLYLRPVDRRLVAGVGLAVAVLGLVHAVLYYRRWRFDIQDDALYLVRGVVTRVDTAVPFVRVQHVDTRRGPIERTLGLASVVVYTAGSRGADIRIPGLRPDRATELRERLRDLAVESEAADAV